MTNLINNRTYSKMILTALAILCLLPVFTKVFADELPRSWTVSRGTEGGIAPTHLLFAVNSKGEIDPNSMYAWGDPPKSKLPTAKKITDSDLAKLKILLKKAYSFSEDKKPDRIFPPNMPDVSISWLTVTTDSGKPKSFYVSNPAVDAFIVFFNELNRKYLK